jgi:hypothetical protein
MPVEIPKRRRKPMQGDGILIPHQGRIHTDANDANASVKIEKSCCLK